MTLQLPPIFCISLARDVGRRSRMISRLDEIGVNYEIINAVDGRELDLSTLGNQLRQDIAYRKYKRHLTAGEIGCYLSHLNLLERIVAENIPAAIVIEDDALLGADFAAVAAAAADIPYEWDMIVLHENNKNRPKEILCKIRPSHVVARMKKRTWCTTCYLVSRAGAQKLLKNYWEVYAPVDAVFQSYWNSGIKLYSAYPFVVVQDNSPTNILDRNHGKEGLYGRIESIKRKIYDFRNPLSRERKAQ